MNSDTVVGFRAIEELAGTGEMTVARSTLPEKPPRLVMSMLKVASVPGEMFPETGFEPIVKSGGSARGFSPGNWAIITGANSPDAEPRMRIRRRDQSGTGFLSSGFDLPRWTLADLLLEKERANLRNLSGMTCSMDIVSRLILGSMNAVSSPSGLWGRAAFEVLYRIVDCYSNGLPVVSFRSRCLERVGRAKIATRPIVPIIT